MSRPLRVLLLEDLESDALLLVHELRAAGLDATWERVETEADYLAHLEPAPDVILADYSLPGFGAVAALRILRERGLDVPFIIVTGTVGEDVAVAAIQEGAADYLLKDRLGRIGPAVLRALEERRLRGERRAAELQLRLQASALDAAANSVVISDREGTILWVNPAFTAMTGYTAEEAQGQNPRMLRSGQHGEAFYGRLWDTILSGRVWAGEIVNRRKDESTYVQEVTITPVVTEGRVSHFVGIAQDVTERREQQEAMRQAEEAVYRSEERYRLLFEEDLTGVFLATPDERIIDCNPAFARIFGFGSVAAAIDRDLTATYPDPASRTLLLDRLRREGKLEHVEMERRRVDGTPVHLIANFVGEIGIEGELEEIKGYVFDNTERKGLEEQFRQAQKMEAVGQLAGGISHDFNNLLSVILGYTELALGGIAPSDPAYARLDQVRRAGRRAADLTRQLLAFSRKQVIAPRVLDLNAILEDLEKMLRRLIGENIELSTVPGVPLGNVRADRAQIEQVVVNLVVNARDAMPEGGRLVVQTTNVELERMNSPVKPGPYVQLTVQDTGVGMTPEVQARIFEPFFTTKELGRGTGLGLATVYGIVKQNGGHIWVYSEPGRGTAFKIYLPRVDEPTEATRPSTVRPLEGTERILVVEDDVSIRDMIEDGLSALGYEVLPAGDLEDALEIVTRTRGKVDVLVTDMLLPKTNGPRIAEGLRREQPDLKVIFMSGYAPETVLSAEMLRDVPFIEKPLGPAELAKMIRQVLDG